MKLEKWALIAEIVGAVTIVLSLIFVGLQVRQSAQQTALNTRQIQSDSYIGLMSEISGINTMMLENPELIDIQNRARSGAEVSELEFKRLVFLYRRVFTLGGMAWVQYEKELINEEDLQRALAIVKVNQEDKIGSLIWGRMPRSMDPGFRAYLEALPEMNYAELTTDMLNH